MHVLEMRNLLFFRSVVSLDCFNRKYSCFYIKLHAVMNGRYCLNLFFIIIIIVVVVIMNCTGEFRGGPWRACWREVNRLCLAMQLLMLHGSPQLLLQDAGGSVWRAVGSVLGLRVRLSRILPHLVLHTSPAQTHDPLREHAQAADTRARSLHRPVLRDLRSVLQQDCSQERNIRRRRITAPSHQQSRNILRTFPKFTTDGAVRYA